MRQGSGGRLRRMWGMRANLKRVLVAVLACVALPASAGTMYRCIGDSGIPAFIDSLRDKPAGSKCERVASFVSERSSAPTPVIDSPVATVPVGHTEPPLPPAPATKGAPRRVSGQVYSYIQNGVRNYSDTTPHGQYGSLRTIHYSYLEQCYACGRNPGVDFAAVPLNTIAYRSEIASASREYGVDEAVVRAIIHAESAFRWNAKSRVGAQGLMQLMPGTARRFGVSDAYDAAQNIRGGVQYLAWLLKRYGSLDKAAAGYNAGEGAVDRHGGVPPYSETRLYVQRVEQLYARYSRELAAR